MKATSFLPPWSFIVSVTVRSGFMLQNSRRNVETPRLSHAHCQTDGYCVVHKCPLNIPVHLFHRSICDVEKGDKRLQLGGENQDAASCRKTFVAVCDHDSNIRSSEAWAIIDTIPDLISQRAWTSIREFRLLTIATFCPSCWSFCTISNFLAGDAPDASTGIFRSCDIRDASSGLSPVSWINCSELLLQPVM